MSAINLNLVTCDSARRSGLTSTNETTKPLTSPRRQYGIIRTR